METKRNWLDEEAVKRDLIELLSTTPRVKWVDRIMTKYGGTAEGRVATFRVFCRMEQAGELDELKRANPNPAKLPKRAAGRAILALLLAVALVPAASAGDRPRKNKNYALRRTEAGQVQGQPLIRRYSGGRTIDVYSNGLMFEGDNVVGVERRPR
jgi:hypothetical protein